MTTHKFKKFTRIKGHDDLIVFLGRGGGWGAFHRSWPEPAETDFVIFSQNSLSFYVVHLAISYPAASPLSYLPDVSHPSLFYFCFYCVAAFSQPAFLYKELLGTVTSDCVSSLSEGGWRWKESV